ncbi:ARD/ARD' family-domain-containing protein [Coniella lustricola]|uniref:Acireductone dioxygenase n=1 Tax=Coniella lustricola TaxID=2025994 RepID=A0A2T3A5M2_9PEZI|nr:ARD/ARD' family-domain-containing protein [Coniella lustricola]
MQCCLPLAYEFLVAHKLDSKHFFPSVSVSAKLPPPPLCTSSTHLKYLQVKRFIHHSEEYKSLTYSRAKMKAYIYDNQPGDQRLPHDSGTPVSPEALEKLGVLYYHMPAVSAVDALALERGYKNRDEITVSPDKMGDVYESKVKSFFAEHLHEDEEIRYIRGGKGFFDVRNKGDDWVRIELEKDDLIILPPGIYHRFTTDETNFVQAMRLFKDEPKWTPLNRSDELDVNHHRKEYVSHYLA